MGGKQRTMIVGIGVGPGAKSAESPGIHNANEGVVIGTFKVAREDLLGELLGLEDLPGPAVGHPPHDARKRRVRQHVLELEGELGTSDFAEGLSGGAAPAAAAAFADRRCQTVHDDVAAAGILVGKVAEIAVNVSRPLAVPGGRSGRAAQAGAVVPLLSPPDELGGLHNAGGVPVDAGGGRLRSRAAATFGHGPRLPLGVLGQRVQAVGFQSQKMHRRASSSESLLLAVMLMLRLGKGEVLLLPQVHMCVLPEGLLGRGHGRHGLLGRSRTTTSSSVPCAGRLLGGAHDAVVAQALFDFGPGRQRFLSVLGLGKVR
jgi:hypothetical protein